MAVWPEHYPEQCPPGEAARPSGSVYRYTNRCNPKRRDFVSHYDRDPEKDWGDKACEARGLSVFSTEADCMLAASVVPALRKKELAKAELPPSSGVIADTPSRNTSNHRTFWSLIEAEELAELFAPVQTVGGASSNV